MASDQGAVTIARFVTKTLTLTSISSDPSISHATPTMIKLCVGENRQIYELPRSLRPYFRRCLGHPYAEGMIRELHFEGEDIVAFGQFVAWIRDEELTVDTSLGLAMTYILADEFCMEAFQDAVVKKAKLVFRKTMISADGLIALCNNGLCYSPLGMYFWAQLAFEMIDGGFGWHVEDENRAW
jgi:hypothetical protein